MSDDIGKRITAARKAIGVNQAFIAKAVGVSRESVSKWESGHITSISAENMSKLARVLNTSIDYLLYGNSVDDGVNQLPSVTSSAKRTLVVGSVGSTGDLITKDIPTGQVAVFSSPQAYALIIDDDLLCMDILMRRGCALIIDPSIEVESGDMVVVNRQYIGRLAGKRFRIEVERCDGIIEVAAGARIEYVLATVGSGGLSPYSADQ